MAALVALRVGLVRVRQRVGDERRASRSAMLAMMTTVLVRYWEVPWSRFVQVDQDRRPGRAVDSELEAPKEIRSNRRHHRNHPH